jgi:two-component system phosphate regulon sensor histidine kinase PhoR
VELKVASGLPGIRADREALRRALWNLLENAVKYSQGPARIRVEAAGDDGQLTIRVRDEGIGIPAEEQERVFEKFYRGKSEQVTRVRGTGLGLSISKHLVEAHGGRIWLESRAGQGSTFFFSIPVRKGGECTEY